MNNRDVEVGRIVQEWRGPSSQQAVADQMRKRGHKWSQSTVWSVEKGERPLKFTEAADLADLCQRDITELNSELPLLEARATVRLAHTALALVQVELDRLMNAQDELQLLLTTKDLPEALATPARHLAELDVVKWVSQRRDQFKESRQSTFFDVEVDQ